MNSPKNQNQSRAEIIASIRRTLTILAQPGQIVELRIPGIQGKRTDSGYFDDFEALATAAAAYENRADAIYITLNPVYPALIARSNNRVKEYAKTTSADKHILRRRWILLDFDPIRPEGISSSDEEKLAAFKQAQACREWLVQQSIPSMLTDSGNGIHLLISIDWPNDEASLKLITEFLTLIDEKFTDERVKVDTGMANASHLVKLYGTMARKGDSIPDRPHRRSTILDVPDSLEPVSVELIQKLVTPEASSEQPVKPETEALDDVQADDQPTTSRDRSFIDEVKSRLDMVAYAEQHFGVQAVDEGRKFRIPGNGGLLIDPDAGSWYHHGNKQGGDAIDLIGHCLYEPNWNNHDAVQFKNALHKAAKFAHVPIPKWTKPQASGKKQAKGKANAQSDGGAKSENAPKIDLLDVAVVWQTKYGQDLAWDIGRSQWRRWNGTHWAIERTSETLDLQAAQMMHEAGALVQSGGRTDGMLKYARGLCKFKFPTGQPLVNFRNGTLDLMTMQLRPHDRSDHLTRCLPYNYDAAADFPIIQQCFQSIIPDPVARQALMTHIGLALIGDRSLAKALILLGPPDAGKTTLLKLSQLVLGYEAGRFPTSVLFCPEAVGANSRASWVDSNPHLVCLDELPKDVFSGQGEDLFKSMASHSGVSMWLKYHDERNKNIWTPKLIFATNNRLRYHDQSGALTRRLLIIECPNSLPASKQDSKLIEKLVPELGTFAAACIRLALVAQETHQYPESQAMKHLLNDVETNGDSLKLWLSERCVIESDAFESTTTLYHDLCEWSSENGVPPIEFLKMRNMILTYYPKIKDARPRITDPQTGEIKLMRGLVGIRLRTDADDCPDDDPKPPDPVDPPRPPVNYPQGPDTQAIRSTDPADYEKSSNEAVLTGASSDAVVKEFPQNGRISGSAPPATSQESETDTLLVADAGTEPLPILLQGPLLLRELPQTNERGDILQFYPDLAWQPERKRRIKHKST